LAGHEQAILIYLVDRINGCGGYGLIDAILHEGTAFPETDRRVLFLCFRLAASLDLNAAKPLDLFVPDLVDPIHPLAPNLTLGSLLGADWQESDDNKQRGKGKAHEAYRVGALA
jgi:hypothetical protein